MANPHKGEVDVEIEGRHYTLAFTANSICEIEDHLDRGWFDIASQMASWGPPTDAKGKPKKETEQEIRQRVSRIRMSLLRALFWGMLREHHPAITLRAAGYMMQNIGEPGGVLDLINRVFERSMPDQKGAASGGPQTPGAAPNANGIGQSSVAPGVN